MNHGDLSPVILGSIATMGWNSFKKTVNLINQ